MSEERAVSEEFRCRHESSFNDDLAERILAGLIEGKSVAALCRLPGMPTQRTVYRWLVSHPGFRRDYVMARNLQAERLAEEILEIADAAGDKTRNEPDAIERARLRIQARRWYLGRLRPHTHGMAIDVPAAPAAAPQVPSLNATERVQRLLALVKDARGGAPIEQTATGEQPAIREAAGDSAEDAEEVSAEEDEVAE